MRNRTELRPIPLRIVVELEQRDSQKLHILRHAQDAALRQLKEVEFLALFGPRAVGRQVRVHEGFVVGAVPLGEGGVDGPVAVARGGGRGVFEGAGGGEALVEAGFEAIDLVGVVGEVVAGARREVELALR